MKLRDTEMRRGIRLDRERRRQITGLGGEVATGLSDTATDPASADRVRKFCADFAIPADSFARAVAFAVSQPDDLDINEILFHSTRQDL
jgi:NADP-dependent 3-hydroxy acid dehydrogenase YdfG